MTSRSRLNRRQFVSVGLTLSILWIGAGPAAIARAQAVLPPVTPATPIAPLDGVRDPVFELLLAFNLGWPAGHLSGAELIRRVEASGRKSPIPYRGVVWQRRTPLADSSGTSVETVFDRPIDLPVPYEVLGYHPGSFRTSGRFVFREERLGDLVLSDDRTKVDKPLEAVSLDDMHLFVLTEGSLEIDIDGWLDKLAGGNLDDTSIQAMAVFVRDGKRYGLALGKNPDGEGRSGVFDFGTEKVLYPTPEDFKIVSRYLRRELKR
ncbi:MAG TPA: hypothetical protein VF720_09085 [Candidatus Eisenbacteria bacterium]